MKELIIFLGILSIVPLVNFLRKQSVPKINTGTSSAVTKYDIQMFFAAIMWNIFWFGLLYYIIGLEKMQEFWFVLVFMFILSLFQYISKWTAAVFLYILSFCFLIGYTYKDQVRVKKTEEVSFTIFNWDKSETYSLKTPWKGNIPFQRYTINPEVGKTIRVEMKNPSNVNFLLGGNGPNTEAPAHHPKKTIFTITAVK